MCCHYPVVKSVNLNELSTFHLQKIRKFLGCLFVCLFFPIVERTARIQGSPEMGKGQKEG